MNLQLPTQSSVEPPEEASATAYKRFQQPIYKVLQQLNEEMAQRATNDPVQWLIEMLSFAIRVEALETSYGLLKYIKQLENRLNPTQLKQFVPLAVDAHLIHGETLEAQRLLLRHIALVAADDRLSTAFLALFDQGQELTESNLLLPSGRLNAFLAAPRANKSSDSLLRIYLSNNKIFGQDPSHQLIIANAVRNISKDGWLSFWNNFLRSRDLPAIIDVDLAQDNFLRQLRFEPQPPVLGHPRVSIIVASYQSSATLAYSLRSILDQSYQNIEVLFCDDGSGDGTMEIASQFADPRLRIFRSRGNQGPYNVRNELLSQATGEYITFHDCDDYALPNRIEVELGEIMKSGALGAVARWVRVRPDGEVVFFRDHGCIRMCVVSFMAHKSLIQGLAPYRTVLCGGDSEIYEMARAKLGDSGIVQIDKPLVLGLWSSASLTQSAGTEALNDGYRSPARRAYAEAAVRQRLLGREVVPDDAIRAILQANGIFREPQGAEAVR